MQETWNESVYIRTSTAKKLYPDNIGLLTVDIVDIANQLAKVCRYNGCLQEDYKVAQHCVIVEELVVEELKQLEILAMGRIHSPFLIKKIRLQALLHDADEAYMPDIPSPYKPLLPDVRELQKKLQQHIFKHFDLPEFEHSIIRSVDKDVRIAEIRSMSLWPEGDSKEDRFPNLHIEPWSWREARDKFLDKFHDIQSIKV